MTEIAGKLQTRIILRNGKNVILHRRYYVRWNEIPESILSANEPRVGVARLRRQHQTRLEQVPKSTPHNHDCEEKDLTVSWPEIIIPPELKPQVSDSEGWWNRSNSPLGTNSDVYKWISQSCD